MSDRTQPSFLIIRLSALGDVIHTLPCLNALRQNFPDARIGWVVEELSREFLEGHPQLDDLFVIPKKRWRGKTLRYLFPEILPFYRDIRSQGYQVAIDFQGLSKSGLVTWLSGAPKRVGYGGVSCREINGVFTNHKIDPGAETVHIIDRNLSLLRAVGIERAEREWVLPEKPAWRERIDQWLVSQGLPAESRFIGVNPGAGWVTKRWPAERFGEVAARLTREGGREALILWGPGENDLAKATLEAIRKNGGRGRLAPPTTVGESIELTRRLDLLIGGDTGPVHLAAALDKPVVVIFGASNGQRNHPGGRRQEILAKPPACGPCWKKKIHPPCDLRCLTDITVDEVERAARRLLTP